VSAIALLAGKDAAAEREVLRQLQALAIGSYSPFGIEPGFDMAMISERPVIISMVAPSISAAGQKAVAQIAYLETLLAAAFFHLTAEDGA